MTKRRHATLWIIPAVVLVLLVASGVWYRGPRSTRDGEPRSIDQPRERSMVALWYAPDGNGGAAGLSRVTARVEPPRDAAAHVGFYESESRGTGETWRAAGWMATVVASLTTGRHLESYLPSFTVNGRIDGPSAGALMAVSLIAALEDDDIRPNRTMTGTILPDGTIGPVGGLAGKVTAAAQAGYDIVLVPRGQGAEAVADSPSIEVVEVGDLHEAYRLVTGRALGVEPAQAERPVPPDVVDDRLAALAEEWLLRYGSLLRQITDVRAEGGTIDVTAQHAAAQETGASARDLLVSGDGAGGYDRAVVATLQASAVLEAMEGLRTARDSGFDALAAALRASVDSEAIDACAAQLARTHIGGTDDLLAVADGLSIATQAKGLTLATEGLIRQLEGTDARLARMSAALRATSVAALNRHVPEIARNRLALIDATAGASAPFPADATGWANTMERAALANLTYFEAVSIAEIAAITGMPVESVRASVGANDLTFILARASLIALPELREQLGPGPPADTATLGAGIGTYAEASGLVARSYCLDPILSDDGELGGVEDAAALDGLLAAAAASARGHIQAARGAGLTAVVPILHYSSAEAHARGTTDEKLEALQTYWKASLYARIGALIERAR